MGIGHGVIRFAKTLDLDAIGLHIDQPLRSFPSLKVQPAKNQILSHKPRLG